MSVEGVIHLIREVVDTLFLELARKESRSNMNEGNKLNYTPPYGETFQSKALFSRLVEYFKCLHTFIKPHNSTGEGSGML